MGRVGGGPGSGGGTRADGVMLMGVVVIFPLALWLAFAVPGPATAPSASDVFAYVGDTGPHHALVAWGNLRGGGNTIGREARGLGPAVLTVGDKKVETTRAWAVVEGLAPDTAYEYKLSIGGTPTGSGRVRTWPEKADSCSFIVMGDFGNGSREQRELAKVIERVINERKGTQKEIRFILTTGDNIYSVIPGVWLAGSGDEDADWGPRYFKPYRGIIASIPVYPTLGNHDGNESEKRADLTVYLDNFFFPGNRPARWYTFNYGGFIDFFALDTTRNTERGPRAAVWLAGSEQHRWAESVMRASKAPWKLAYMHHPIFNAGPRHQEERNYERMSHFFSLFAETGVQAVFQGHEHNLQVSEANKRSRGARYFITGAGGELRDGDITSSLKEHNIEGFSPKRHFMVVDISGDSMDVMPVADGPIEVRRADGSTMSLPVKVPRRIEVRE